MAKKKKTPAKRTTATKTKPKVARPVKERLRPTEAEAAQMKEDYDSGADWKQLTEWWGVRNAAQGTQMFQRASTMYPKLKLKLRKGRRPKREAPSNLDLQIVELRRRGTAIKKIADELNEGKSAKLRKEHGIPEGQEVTESFIYTRIAWLKLNAPKLAKEIISAKSRFLDPVTGEPLEGKELIDNLSSKMKSIYQMAKSGSRVSEIAEALGYAQPSIVSNALSKLRDAGLDVPPQR